MNLGFTFCSSCQRGQSRLKEIVGRPSNIIALLAVLLTFSQLILTSNESRKASRSASDADKALTEISVALSRIEKIEGSVQGLLQSTQENARNSTDTYLKIRELEANLDEFSDQQKVKIDIAKVELNAASVKYNNLASELAEIEPTITTIQRKRTCRMYFLRKKCKDQEIPVTVKNPEYVAFQKQVLDAESILKQKEQVLSMQLNSEQ